MTIAAANGGRVSRPTSICMLVAITSLLAACQSVSEDPTVPAFASLAADVHTSLDTARAGEAEAFRGQTIREAIAHGQIISHGCLRRSDSTTASGCQVLITVDGKVIDTGEVGPRVAGLAATLDAYGRDLKTLAAARDITDQQAALNKIGASADTLLKAAGVPGVSVITNLATELIAQGRLQKRREVILRIALKVNPSIAPIAAKIQADLLKLQDNVLEGRIYAVTDLQVRYQTSGGLDADQRAAIAQKLFDATAAVREAADLSVDIGKSLPAAHETMIASLKNPRISVAAALKEFSVIEGDADQIAAALGPSKT